MDQHEDQIKEYLKMLDLTPEEAELYLSLAKYGESTTLELSRFTKISRTQIYRLFESMKNKGVIEEIIDKNTTRARAVDVDRLYDLIENISSKVETLKDQFPQVKTLLSGLSPSDRPGTKVLFYRGEEGLQQLAWNALRAKDELRGYTYRLWESAIGEKFARKWFKEAILRGFKMREIYSDEYLKSVKGIKSLVTLPEFKNFSYVSRYIPSKTLTIDHQVDIYNDVVAYYNWFKGEVFGVEIYNKKIAAMQKQIFDIIWTTLK